MSSLAAAGLASLPTRPHQRIAAQDGLQAMCRRLEDAAPGREERKLRPDRGRLCAGRTHEGDAEKNERQGPTREEEACVVRQSKRAASNLPNVISLSCGAATSHLTERPRRVQARWMRARGAAAEHGGRELHARRQLERVVGRWRPLPLLHARAARRALVPGEHDA